ncbi:MAG: hypothetical protein MUP85_20925 [Candidatus Lokiarchaeota archaeon]|nr:hypothetical protein [Candidatus Lokiarchaeota archaeon]
MMIEQLEKLRDIDDKIFETVKDLTKNIPWLINESPIPYTAEFFLMYIRSSNFIKNSIFDCSETEDLYSVKILFRSLIEHYLRFQFVFTKYGLSKNDEESKKYFEILELSEHLDYLKSLKKVAFIQSNDISSLNDVWDDLSLKFPSFKKFPIKELEKYAQEFSIKNVITFLEEKIGPNEKENGFLLKIIPEYSELSSFVHGGIFAYKNHNDFLEQNERTKEFLRICGLSLQIASSIKMFSYLVFYQHKKEFGVLYNSIQKLLKKIE